MSERLAWRTPLRVLGSLALASVVGLVIASGLYAATLMAMANDPALGRTLVRVAGPTILRAPVPYWALVRRLARRR